MADNDNIYLSANGVKHLTNKPMESMSKDGHMEKGKRNKMLVSLHHTNTKPFPAEILLDWVNANCATLLKHSITKNVYRISQDA